MEYAIIAIGCFLILVTALPWLNSTKWWIRVWDFPRMQISVVALAVLLLYVIYFLHVSLWSLIFTGLVACVFIYHILKILPYTRFFSAEIKETISGDSNNTFSILTCNIYMNNRKYGVFKSLVAKYRPEIVLVVETDEYWVEELKVLTEVYPYYKFVPQNDTYGMTLLSKLELRNVTVRQLVEKDIPSIEADVVLPSGNQIKLYCLHPAPPVPNADGTGKHDGDTEERDAELLIVGKKVKQDGLPAIVVGDLNDVAWSYTTHLFQKISGMLDPRVGRFLCNSYNARIPLLRFPLDHFFLTTHFTYDALKKLEFIGSDHFPIFLKCSYNNGQNGNRQKKSSDKEEAENAEAKITEGLNE